VNSSLNGLSRRVDQLEQLPFLQRGIPPAHIVLPLTQFTEDEQNYVQALPAGASAYEPGYVLINLAELSNEHLDALSAILEGDFSDFIPHEELIRRFLSIDENRIPAESADAPVYKDARGIAYHLHRTAFRAMCTSVQVSRSCGWFVDAAVLRMWIDIFGT